MKWNIQKKYDENVGAQELIADILALRGIQTEAEKQAFVRPVHPLELPVATAGLSPESIVAAVRLLQKTKDAGQPILIYGDYDADGITATAILWEALHTAGYKVTPFIPNREDHGYGLSRAGLEDALVKFDQQPLVITVDNGITAIEEAKYLRELGITLLITDHHQIGEQVPECEVLVHSDQIAGSAVAWFLAREINPESVANSLDLAAIGTMCDLLPQSIVNRAICAHGIQKLQEQQRVGVRALLHAAGIDEGTELTSYHIGYVIGPRLNAMGRLADAMDSLRLLCTPNTETASRLSALLNDTNKERRQLTFSAVEDAMDGIEVADEPLLMLASDEYHEGVIGLIAGRLSEAHARPAIVMAIKGDIAKGSARSLEGVNIIELIRKHEDMLLNAGGHPAAAGFSIETSKIDAFIAAMMQTARREIDTSALQQVLTVDVALPLASMCWELSEQLDLLKPYGVDNYQPVFASTDLQVQSVRQVGQEGKHVSLRVADGTGASFMAIAFNHGELYEQIAAATSIDLAYTLDINEWNGRRKLQLKVKGVRF